MSVLLYSYCSSISRWMSIHGSYDSSNGRFFIVTCWWMRYISTQKYDGLVKYLEVNNGIKMKIRTPCDNKFKPLNSIYIGKSSNRTHAQEAIDQFQGGCPSSVRSILEHCARFETRFYLHVHIYMHIHTFGLIDGTKMLFIPPNLTLIFRHKFDSVCGEVLLTFFAWTHWVAIPNTVSPTLFTSAGINWAI